MKRVWLFVFFLTGACMDDETISGFVEQDRSYRLQSIDGTPFPASATIRFSSDGMVTGKAPCNSFGAQQRAVYPWFDLGPIRATRRACADLDHENFFLRTLQVMTEAEVSGPVLILRNDAGAEMVFHLAETTETP